MPKETNITIKRSEPKCCALIRTADALPPEGEYVLAVVKYGARTPRTVGWEVLRLAGKNTSCPMWTTGRQYLFAMEEASYWTPLPALPRDVTEGLHEHQHEA